MRKKQIDIITMGRSSIDLYANEIGVPFTEIKSFGAFVGGCPTNIAVGTRRLGLRSLLLTAVGEDVVGDFVVNFLEREGVDTRFISRKHGRRTSAVLLGIEPPDRFPLVFYRDNCADMALTVSDVAHVPIRQAKILLVTGTGLSREPSRSATVFAARSAQENGVKVILDIDFRADQWLSDTLTGYGQSAAYPSEGICHKPEGNTAFGDQIRNILPYIDIAIGTEEEVKAVYLKRSSAVKIMYNAVSDPSVPGARDVAISRLLKEGGLEVLIVKQGERGSVAYTRGGQVVEAPPFQVPVCNILGAGDAFASGFVYAYLKGWDLLKSLEMANAVGAIVVTRQGCANFMPYEAEALQWLKDRLEGKSHDTL